MSALINILEEFEEKYLCPDAYDQDCFYPRLGAIQRDLRKVKDLELELASTKKMLDEAKEVIGFMEREDWSTLDEGNVIKMLRNFLAKQEKKTLFNAAGN